MRVLVVVMLLDRLMKVGGFLAISLCKGLNYINDIKKSKSKRALPNCQARTDFHPRYHERKWFVCTWGQYQLQQYTPALPHQSLLPATIHTQKYPRHQCPAFAYLIWVIHLAAWSQRASQVANAQTQKNILEQTQKYPQISIRTDFS